PMYFLIGGWGGPRRAQAAVKFLIYSLAGGLVMLFGVIGVGVQTAQAGAPSFLISDVAALHLSSTTGRWLFVAFFIAFAVKAPMVPVHTWLPDTAEQATPGSSTLLVGILDKIGTFGMIRLCLGMFPEPSKWATPVILILALVSIFWGALMAIGSRNLMRLISYTSVSHFGFMVLGIFALTTQSLSGSIFYMLNHGFSTAALFLAVGYLVKRRGSADIGAFGGVEKVAPVGAGLFLVAGLSTLALPGMSSFISEFMVMAGTWQRHPWLAAISTLGTVLAALYVLLAYQRTMTGPATEVVQTHFTGRDVTGRERLVMVPLIALLLVFGFYPKPMLQVVEHTAKTTMATVGMTDPAPAAVQGGK
ncbi:MAG: NADH-quinone oxidoreductase subunit M, partial [Propionibacterium sp.]|nr:NADH-quinone oxidoreductase subunit M [Propionibacterium sp.]